MYHEYKNGLIEAAKKALPRKKKNYPREEVELAIAYATGEVSMRQAQVALGHKHVGTTANWVIARLCQFVRENT